MRCRWLQWLIVTRSPPKVELTKILTTVESWGGRRVRSPRKRGIISCSKSAMTSHYTANNLWSDQDRIKCRYDDDWQWRINALRNEHCVNTVSTVAVSDVITIVSIMLQYRNDTLLTLLFPASITLLYQPMIQCRIKHGACVYWLLIASISSCQIILSAARNNNYTLIYS